MGGMVNLALAFHLGWMAALAAVLGSVSVAAKWQSAALAWMLPAPRSQTGALQGDRMPKKGGHPRG